MARYSAVICLWAALQSSCSSADGPRGESVAARFGAYQFLIGRDVHVAAERCGLVNSLTREWASLWQLIESGDVASIEHIARHAITPEGRVLGTVGLYRLGALSRAEAAAALSNLRVDVNSCWGCVVTAEPSAEFVYLFDRLPARDVELGLDEVVGDVPGAIELPGVERR